MQRASDTFGYAGRVTRASATFGAGRRLYGAVQHRIKAEYTEAVRGGGGRLRQQERMGVRTGERFQPVHNHGGAAIAGGLMSRCA